MTFRQLWDVLRYGRARPKRTVSELQDEIDYLRERNRKLEMQLALAIKRADSFERTICTMSDNLRHLDLT